MKKSFVSCLLAVLIVVVGFGLSACDREGRVTDAKVVKKDDALVVIQVLDYIGDATLYDALVYLRAENALDFESEKTLYGQSLLSLNGVDNPTDWSYYWASYVCTQSFGNPDVIYTYNGESYYYANYGIDGVYLEKGGIYVWVFEESALW